MMQVYARRDRQRAAALGDSGRRRPAWSCCWWSSGCSSRPAPSGSGRLLCPRADPRHPAHQPVLDAGQRHLRRAPGQAAVRLHRRRRQPGRRHGRGITALLVERVGTNNLLLVSAAVLVVCVVLVVVRSSGASDRAGSRDAATTGEGEGRRRRRGDHAAAPVAPPADHRARHRLRRDGRGHHRAAAEHGGRGRSQGAAPPTASPHSSAQVTVYLSLVGFVVQVALTSRIHRLLGIGFALLILPVSLGATAVHHARQRGALWAPALGARPRHVAALHGRQDDAGDPVPAAAGRAQVPGEAVHRRHDGPLREGRWARC